MILLRLLADILLYLALGLFIYWLFTDNTTALWMAIGCGLASLILFVFTYDIRRYREGSFGIWDWLFYIDLLEIPFRILLWLFRGLWRIFD